MKWTPRHWRFWPIFNNFAVKFPRLVRRCYVNVPRHAGCRSDEWPQTTNLSPASYQPPAIQQSCPLVFFPLHPLFTHTQLDHTFISSNHLFRPITTLRIPSSFLSTNLIFSVAYPRCAGTAVASHGSSSISYLCSFFGELS